MLFQALYRFLTSLVFIKMQKHDLGKCKPSAKKEDHPPAHFRLNEPPGDQGRGVLQAVLHRGERPEVIRLGNKVEIQEFKQMTWVLWLKDNLWKNKKKDGHEDGGGGRADGDQGIAKSLHFESIAPAGHEDWRLQYFVYNSCRREF